MGLPLFVAPESSQAPQQQEQPQQQAQQSQRAPQQSQAARSFTAQEARQNLQQLWDQNRPQRQQARRVRLQQFRIQEDLRPLFALATGVPLGGGDAVDAGAGAAAGSMGVEAAAPTAFETTAGFSPIDLTGAGAAAGAGAGADTGAGSTREKTEAELLADRLYEEAIAEQMARMEGGA